VRLLRSATLIRIGVALGALRSQGDRLARAGGSDHAGGMTTRVKMPERISEEEFFSWPVTLTKVELVDGDVVCAPAPTYGHQEALRRLVMALGRWAEGGDSGHRDHRFRSIPITDSGHRDRSSGAERREVPFVRSPRSARRAPS
jgi:hypothetical protein